MKKKIFAALITLICGYRSIAQLPFTQSTVISGLNMPVAFAIAPNDGRFFVTLKAGTIVVYASTGSLIGTFYSLNDSTYNNFERGLLGICFDPDYSTNKYVYAYYVHRWPNNSNGVQQLRVIRFTDNNNVGGSPAIIFAQTVSNSIPGNHVGGNIRFRPSDGKLYISIGELATPSNAQSLTNPFGKILRINKDGTIPIDNPFYDNGNPSVGNDDRIWEYGHRNPFDFTFGPNDSLYISENGENTQDEMNLGRRGGNYGWQTCEGNNVYGTNNPCNFPNLINPLTVWTAPLNGITGIIFYNGCMFPEYKNHIIIGNNDVGEIWDCILGNAPAYSSVTSKSLITDLTSSGGLTTLAQGSDGSIYAMNGGYTTSGNIYKLSRTISPTITAGGPTSFCAGSNVVLNASPAGYSYQWYRNNILIAGATNISYQTGTTGTYKVMICNNSSNTIHVTSYTNPTSTISPSVSPQYICSGSSIVFNANTGTGLTYQWKKNGTSISGATNSSYTATSAGIYKVLVTNSNGCTKNSNQVKVIIQTCKEEMDAESNSEISPNPFTTEFRITFPKDEIYGICIYDLSGRKLIEAQQLNGEYSFGKELSDGVYLLQIINSSGATSVKRIVKLN
ncbi:MAG TPA: hypothetical protein DCQ93_08005 [Bacteroidetes bacterium]|nr:hypothetical protein [Bacteroidota bacterium]